MPVTLTRSSSCDDGKLCIRTFRRSESPHTVCATQKWPKCPGGNTEWQKLTNGLRAAFFQCNDVSAEHPAAACLASRDVGTLRDELFSQGQWKPGVYTRTRLLDGDAFNVQLLCWAPGCASPVHGHSCADTLVESNCFLLVLEGNLLETIYGEDAILPDGKAVDSRRGEKHTLRAGQMGYINDSLGLHKVENQSDARAVSLHVYAPGWTRPPLFDEIFPEVDAAGAEFDCSWGDF